MKNYIDNDGNQITSRGKLLAGALLLLFTSLSAVLIIALWPDRIPSSTAKAQSYYKVDFFHVRLINIPDSCLDKINLECMPKESIDSAKKTEVKISDSIEKDTINRDTTKKMVKVIDADEKDMPCIKVAELMHLNTLLLLLVALAGFLGTMIHVSTSFVTFIGVGQFKDSWLLWYIVKPFIGAMLAITIYFALCGGFLTINNNPNNINIYGVLTVAILTGLFADRATLKLKELFDVLLKPKEERTDPLAGGIKIVKVEPLLLERGKENIITITIENMLKEKLKFLIDDKEVLATISGAVATIKYSIADGLDKVKLDLVVKNEKDVKIFKETLSIKED